METGVFDAEEHLRLFREMLTCGSEVFSWTYDGSGKLLDTNCGAMVLHRIFEATGCLEAMLSYAREESAPVLLSAPLGVMWCAVFRRTEDGEQRCHVIGPVFNTDLSSEGIRRATDKYDIPVDWRLGFITTMKMLPVVSTTLFFQYGLMLHYCATGEKLSRSEIRFHSTGSVSGTDEPGSPEGDRNRTYMAEQAILRHVREGDPNYKDTLERANLFSNGVRISAYDPIDQVRVSLTAFITLCSRAAIEGGLSPDLAYSLGDSYIQDVLHSETVSDLRTISHNMYEDFIQRVRMCREDTFRSPQVRSCCDYIDLHLEEPLNLKLLAQRVGYNEYYFSRKFREETGASVSDYIRSARIERGKSLLTTTDLPVGEIALRLQFSSSSHFSDAFRKSTGMLPQAWRKENLHV